VDIKMIEITYNHKICNDTLYRKKITLGHGLPTLGQLDFISLIKEDVSREDGVIIYASYKWGFGLWRVKEKINNFIDRIRRT